MEGRIYIDDIDIYTTYGLYVVESGYNGLIEWPALKPVDFNDWHERDGIEPDLSAPVLDKHEFTLSLAGRTPRAKADAFIATFGNNGAYHTLRSDEILRQYDVRLVSADPVDEQCGICFVTITLADDFPLKGYTPLAPRSTIAPYNDYAIDDKLFTDYGANILEGSLAEITRTPDVKTNLERSVASLPGLMYDAEVVRYKEYDATLHCLMRAQTLTELWRNYDALLYNLVQPEPRYIGVSAVSKRYPCYYQSQRVNRFYGTGKIWLEFEITVKVFTTPENI